MLPGPGHVHVHVHVHVPAQTRPRADNGPRHLIERQRTGIGHRLIVHIHDWCPASPSAVDPGGRLNESPRRELLTTEGYTFLYERIQHLA